MVVEPYDWHRARWTASALHRNVNAIIGEACVTSPLGRPDVMNATEARRELKTKSRGDGEALFNAWAYRGPIQF